MNVTMIFFLISCVGEFKFLLRRVDHLWRKEENDLALRTYGVRGWSVVFNQDLSDSRHSACSVSQIFCSRGERRMGRSW